MSQSYETIRVEDKGAGLTLLSLNRPQVANAMNTQMGRDLLGFFETVNADPLAHGCIVVTGAGDKAFCARDELLDETLETARRIADNAPISVRQAKHSIHYGLQMDLASAMMFEIEAYNRMVPTEDRREGIASFNEKRKPRFKGR